MPNVLMRSAEASFLSEWLPFFDEESEQRLLWSNPSNLLKTIIRCDQELFASKP